LSPAHRRHTQQFALWLALAAVLLRALLPDGFMPERGANGVVALQFCYASPLAKLRAPQGTPAGDHAHASCAFAAAAAPGLPRAGIQTPSFPLAVPAIAPRQALALVTRFNGGRPPARGPPAIS
jgi:hypothetical protein